MNTQRELVVFADLDGRIVDFDSQCERITGYSAREVIGKNLVEQLVPESWRKIVRQRFSATPFYHVENPHCNPWRAKDGKEKMIEWSCSLLSGENGPLVVGRGKLCDGAGGGAEINWDKVKMISFDGCNVSFVLEGEGAARVYRFQNFTEMDAALRRWFTPRSQEE